MNFFKKTLCDFLFASSLCCIPLFAQAEEQITAEIDKKEMLIKEYGESYFNLQLLGSYPFKKFASNDNRCATKSFYVTNTKSKLLRYGSGLKNVFPSHIETLVQCSNSFYVLRQKVKTLPYTISALRKFQSLHEMEIIQEDPKIYSAVYDTKDFLSEFGIDTDASMAKIIETFGANTFRKINPSDQPSLDVLVYDKIEPSVLDKNQMQIVGEKFFPQAKVEFIFNHQKLISIVFQYSYKSFIDIKK